MACRFTILSATTFVFILFSFISDFYLLSCLLSHLLIGYLSHMMLCCTCDLEIYTRLWEKKIETCLKACVSSNKRNILKWYWKELDYLYRRAIVPLSLSGSDPRQWSLNCLLTEAFSQHLLLKTIVDLRQLLDCKEISCNSCWAIPQKMFSGKITYNLLIMYVNSKRNFSLLINCSSILYT